MKIEKLNIIAINLHFIYFAQRINQLIGSRGYVRPLNRWHFRQIDDIIEAIRLAPRIKKVILSHTQNITFDHLSRLLKIPHNSGFRRLAFISHNEM